MKSIFPMLFCLVILLAPALHAAEQGEDSGTNVFFSPAAGYTIASDGYTSTKPMFTSEEEESPIDTLKSKWFLGGSFRVTFNPRFSFTVGGRLIRMEQTFFGPTLIDPTAYETYTGSEFALMFASTAQYRFVTPTVVPYIEVGSAVFTNKLYLGVSDATASVTIGAGIDYPLNDRFSVAVKGTYVIPVSPGGEKSIFMIELAPEVRLFSF